MPQSDDRLPDTIVREIETFLDDWLCRTDAPGASVAVFDGDGLLHATGLGARDLESTAPATEATLYNVGSITKVVTAVAVLQLVEDDALALDDAVADHVPFLREVPGDPITVRELLTHTSGMPTDDVVLREGIADLADLRRHVDGAADRRLADGERFMYYNSGYKVLGELVAAVDGREYADYVEREVLAPLGMERSTFDQSVLAEDDDAMTGYVTEDDELVPHEGGLDFESEPADGGLVASVTDLSRLVCCLLAGGALDGTRLLEADTVAEMTSHHATRETTVDGVERGYGYGLMHEPFGGGTLVCHGGAVEHARAYAGGLPERGLGVAVAANAGDVPVAEAAKGVLAVAAGESPPAVVPGLGLREKLGAVTGTYEGYRASVTATVEDDDGRLVVTVEPWDLAFPAFPESSDPDDYSFYTVERDGRRVPVEFREVGSGMALLWSRARLDRTCG